MSGRNKRCQSSEIAQQVKEMHESGKTVSMISTELGISRNTLAKIAKRNGFSLSEKTFRLKRNTIVGKGKM